MPTDNANAPSPLRPTAFEWLVLAAGLVLTNQYAWLLDDAFIFFRYVDNWVLLDSGLVYNRGEFVEGFTSPAWTLLLGALRSTGLDYWMIVRGVGLIAFGTFWWMLVVLARDLAPGGGRRRLIVDFPLAYLGLNYAVLCYFTSGVEAPLVQIAAVAYALHLVRPDRRLPEFVVAASTLIRPELALATALAVGWRTLEERRPPWRLIAMAGALVGGWLVFRVAYYADLLPNTFYLKHLADWGQGVVYLHETLATYGAYAIAALFGLGYAALRRSGGDPHARARLGMLLIAGAIALYFVRVGGDPRHYRYLAFPFCLAVCALGGLVELALERFAPERFEGPRGHALLLAASVLFALAVASRTPPQLGGHPAFGPVVHTMQHGINDAAYHRQHERLALDPWSDDRVSKALPTPMATDDYPQVTNASWCEWAYRLPGMRVIQNLGLTDAILARVEMPPDRPAHKTGLQPMAEDLEAVHRAYTAAPGMIRLALEQGRGAAWMRANLDSIEVIERKIYNRHDFLENLALAFSFPDRIVPPAVSPGRRNLVFIVIDTLRWDHVDAYHPSERELTPALDAFAQTAVRFERAYASAPWTRPSIGSMLTGLHPSRHGGTAVDQPLSETVETLPEMLRGEGYQTAGVVSNWVISRKNGFAQGFDRYDEAAAARHQASTSEAVTQTAIADLDALAANPEPFMLFVHYFDPHYRYLPHAEVGFAEGEVGRIADHPSVFEVRALGPDLSAAETRNLRDLYAEEVHHTDAQVGRLLARLDAGDLLSDTVVVVTSDHGEEIFERGYLGHAHSLHEELVRVPLLIRAPGAGPRVVPETVSLVSLAPTLLDLLGVGTAGRAFQAGSLADRVLGKAGADDGADRFVFFEVDYLPDVRVERTARKRGVIADGWKLVVDRDSGAVTLFDLRNDPDERDDQSGRQPERVAGLRAVLEAHDRANQQGAHPTSTRALSPEDRARLEELGYLEPAP